MRLRQSCATLLFTLACLVAISSPALAGEDWKPVDPQLLSMKSPVVEKDADAEAIFWEVRLNDADRDLIFSHYIRIKVFTDRGKESQSKIDIPYFGRYKIQDVAGRTIKPDGTIVELKKDAIFDREIVKVSGLKIKAKTFAMPAVEAGVVIEYRWREVRPYTMANYVRLQFQRDIPVQTVKYFVKPYSFDTLGMRAQTFNGPGAAFAKEKDGFHSMTMNNMPAFREEPYMPPEDQVRAWTLIYYTRDSKIEPQKFWRDHAKEVFDATKGKMKPNAEIASAAATIIGDASTPEQKLERLFEFCRTEIKDIYDDASGLTEADLEKMKPNDNAAQTLKRKMGTGGDINFLFAALATAAGFEARVAKVSDRSDIFFDASFTDGYFLGEMSIAVHVGDTWRFFDPGSTYVPFGMLRWQEEGIEALICDAKAPEFVRTPLSTPEKSAHKRTATLALSEDGTLEGDVRVEFTGQAAAAMKEQNDEDSPQQREANLVEQLKKRLSTSEVSNIRIENVTDKVKPFVYSYHVRIPGYAQRTGKRLFLQPAFFQRGIGALFPSKERKNTVYFHYPWLEQDEIEIKLPAGYALDNAEQPPPISAGEVLRYEMKIGVVNKAEALKINRKLRMSGLVFPVTSYGDVKRLFDALHESDNHTITLKQAAQ